MYQHQWHDSIAAILERLPARTLLDHQCYFGGGTALVLQSAKQQWPIGGEYRRSEDIDFLCTNAAFLAAHRRVKTDGIGVFTGDLELAREPIIDGYGIRLAVVSPTTGDKIKVELVSDGVLPVHTPGEVIHGVTCLSLADSTAHKLMANSDRWADRAVALRHYIDLMVISSSQKGLPTTGWEAAVAAYSLADIESTLEKAHQLLQSENYIERFAQILSLPPRTVECLHAFAKRSPKEALTDLRAGIQLPAPNG